MCVVQCVCVWYIRAQYVSVVCAGGSLCDVCVCGACTVHAGYTCGVYDACGVWGAVQLCVIHVSTVCECAGVAVCVQIRHVEVCGGVCVSAGGVSKSVCGWVSGGVCTGEWVVSVCVSGGCYMCMGGCVVSACVALWCVGGEGLVSMGGVCTCVYIYGVRTRQ